METRPSADAACQFALDAELADILLAVHGTLMRGLELNGNAAGLAQILLAEPSGLCPGKVRLAGQATLGVLGEPALCEGQREITGHGGWRAYVAARAETRA